MAPREADLVSVGTSYREVTFSQLKETFQLIMSALTVKAVSRTNKLLATGSSQGATRWKPGGL